MKKYILWIFIVVFVIGCSSTTPTPNDDNTAQLITPRPIKPSSTIVSLSYQKDFTADEQSQCALINAELALSEKLDKIIDEKMKESRTNNKMDYEINLPCVSKKDLNLSKNVKSFKGENSNSYKTWKVEGSDTLYIWAW